MELVKNDPENNLKVEKKEMPEAEALQMIVDAYQAGEITITRARRYKNKKPKTGHIWYKIDFNQGKQNIYRGAYEMDLVFEDHCKAHDKLTHFLLYQLRGELQNFQS